MSFNYSVDVFATFIVILGLIFLANTKTLPQTMYTAAVYEHHIYSVLNSSFEVLGRNEAVKMMNRNLDVYERAVKQAKRQNVDIIVFPEDGLYGFGFLRESFLPFTENIPDPKKVSWTPCVDPGRYTPVQNRLSCLARTNSMYIVANMGDVKYCDNVTDPDCPWDGRYQYNTDVVFDSNGTLVARYHKRHLFMIEMLNYNRPDVEYITFDTPFAGTFGVFTCFDVLFKDPAVSLVETDGVRNVVFPTAWMNALPLLSAVQFHQAWAMGMGVNFLASNTHLVNKRMTGSGIYTPQGAANFTYNAETEDGQLVVAKIPSSPKPNSKDDHEIERISEDTVDFVADVFKDPFNFVRLKVASGNVSVCHKSLCCYLSYSKDENSDELYAFGAFDGLHTYEGQYYLQVCTLLKCANDTSNSCGVPTTQAKTVFNYLNMKGSYGTPHIFPEVLTSGIGLAVGQWSFYNRGLLSPGGIDEPLLSASLFGRWYDRDQGGIESETDLNGCTTDNVAFLIDVLLISHTVCTLLLFV